MTRHAARKFAYFLTACLLSAVFVYKIKPDLTGWLGEQTGFTRHYVVYGATDLPKNTRRWINKGEILGWINCNDAGANEFKDIINNKLRKKYTQACVFYILQPFESYESSDIERLSEQLGAGNKPVLISKKGTGYARLIVNFLLAVFLFVIYQHSRDIKKTVSGGLLYIANKPYMLLAIPAVRFVVNKTSDLLLIDHTWATNFLDAVLISPIYEELLYRYAIYSWILKYSPQIVAAAFTSILFGLMHPGHPLTSTVAGVILQYMFIKSGSLLPGVVAHALNNFLHTMRVTPPSVGL